MEKRCVNNVIKNISEGWRKDGWIFEWKMNELWRKDRKFWRKDGRLPLPQRNKDFVKAQVTWSPCKGFASFERYPKLADGTSKGPRVLTTRKCVGLHKGSIRSMGACEWESTEYIKASCWNASQKMWAWMVWLVASTKWFLYSEHIGS